MDHRIHTRGPCPSNITGFYDMPSNSFKKFPSGNKPIEKRYVNHNWPVCGSRPYNPHVLLCCGDVIHAKYTVRRCCGRKAYNPGTAVCCGNTLRYFYYLPYVSKQAFTCCGNALYNTQMQMCCSGVVTKKVGGAYGSCCGKTGYNRLVILLNRFLI